VEETVRDEDASVCDVVESGYSSAIQDSDWFSAPPRRDEPHAIEFSTVFGIFPVQLLDPALIHDALRA
jgi:hypothetical protein